MAELVATAIGAPAVITHLEARKEAVHALADHDKLERALDYRARWSLTDGLQRMAEWAKHVGPSCRTSRQDIEVMKNLPQSWRA